MEFVRYHLVRAPPGSELRLARSSIQARLFASLMARYRALRALR